MANSELRAEKLWEKTLVHDRENSSLQTGAAVIVL